ncbi:MAG: DUF429 domain-containing protein [Verrucomicrobiota bacterium]
MIWGLDGARGGWVLSRRIPSSRSGAEVFFCLSLAEVLDFTGSERVAVDMPIGLATAASPQRKWDVDARRVLRGRLSSRVFTPPIQEVLNSASYAEANQRSKALIGKGISVQAWNLVPKIRELEATLQTSPELSVRWEEAHPEIAFAKLNGGAPIVESKKTDKGEQIRGELLRRSAGIRFDSIWSDFSKAGVRGRFARDDVLDSLALAASEIAFP